MNIPLTYSGCQSLKDDPEISAEGSNVYWEEKSYYIRPFEVALGADSIKTVFFSLPPEIHTRLLVTYLKLKK